MTPGDKEKAEHLFKLLCEEHQPETEYQKHCLRENAYARTLADRCQDIGMAILENDIHAAHVHWDTDQEIAAEQLALKLPKNPTVVSKQLTKTPQGVAVLDERWCLLGDALEDNGLWTESQRRMALDLCGVPLEFREGRTLIDPKEGEDARTVALELVEASLQELRDPTKITGNASWEQFRRDMALEGVPVTISPELRLTKRYEAMHIRRANQAMAEFLRAKNGGEEPSDSSSKGLGLLTLRSRMDQSARVQARSRMAAASAAAPKPAPTPSAKPAQPATSASAAAPKTAPTAPPAAAQPAAKLPWAYDYNRKYAQAAKQGPQRDREAERAQKKDERKARNKQQKNQRHKG
jgi:hypothetical protein